MITIAPGKTLSWLAEQFGKDVKIVRCMPNTPAMVGEGMTAACPNEHMTEEEIEYVKTLLSSFSLVEIVPEKLMDTDYSSKRKFTGLRIHVYRSDGRRCCIRWYAESAGL